MKNESALIPMARVLTVIAVLAAAWAASSTAQTSSAPKGATLSTAATVAASPAATSATAAKPAPVLPPVTGEALAHTCSGCHGTQGRLADEAFMPLAGMPAAGFVKTMQDFRSGRRPATLMGHIARGLNDAEFQSMAEYFARQTPAPGSAAALNPLRPAQPGAPR